MRFQGAEVIADSDGMPVHPSDGTLCDWDADGVCVDCGQSRAS